MALVLKKSLTPKHLTLLQCIRKRNYVSNKSKHIASISRSSESRVGRFAEQTALKYLIGRLSEATKTAVEKKLLLPRRCYSCITHKTTRNDTDPTATSARIPVASFRSLHNLDAHYALLRLYPTYHMLHATYRKESSVKNQPPNTQEDLEKLIKGAWAVSSCPCPCNCNLPPPCNQPPRCLQSMSGYYHYPYGFWFSGPYHVNTGPVPVDGPVKPGGPCGPVAGCPNFGSCGPPCRPCGPCGPCACGPCACGLCACGPCGLCALCYPQTPYTQGSYPMYNYGAFYNQSNYPSVYSSYSQPNQCGCPNHSGYDTQCNTHQTQSCGREETLEEDLKLTTDTLPSTVQSESTGRRTSGEITIDPKFAKTFPFNKPTFRRRTPML